MSNHLSNWTLWFLRLWTRALVSRTPTGTISARTKTSARACWRVSWRSAVGIVSAALGSRATSIPRRLRGAAGAPCFLSRAARVPCRLLSCTTPLIASLSCWGASLRSWSASWSSLSSVIDVWVVLIGIGLGFAECVSLCVKVCLDVSECLCVKTDLADRSRFKAAREGDWCDANG